MKTTSKLVLSLCAIVFSIDAYAQIKVIANGKVGINQPWPSYNLDVTGSTRLNGYVGINGVPAVGYPLNVTSYYGEIIMIDPSTMANGSVIGSSTDEINFWYSTTNHNRVYASSFHTTSDSTLKRNIRSLPGGALNKVMGLRPVSFKYKDEPDTLNRGRQSLGLIAQEVEAIIPEAVSFNRLGNVNMINYDMIIPVLIKAMQEQETLIESLQKEIKKLKSESSTSKGSTNSKSSTEDTSSNSATLEQNTPNPFNQKTEIRFFIPETFSSAMLCIYNMSGMQIKSFPITEKGYGMITINGSDLYAGMYLYTLIVDGMEVDTKRMILTQ